jgi:hypothetical protein
MAPNMSTDNWSAATGDAGSSPPPARELPAATDEAAPLPDAAPAANERRRFPEPGPIAEEAARLAESARDWAGRAVPELAALLRGDRPEVTGKFVEAGAAVAAAARAVLDTLVSPAPRTEEEKPPPPGPRVEPIDVE